jgi:hypothetical protein
MSIREKPVASRFLDVHEKHYHYQKHVNAVASSRATINTKRPEVPRRLMVAAVANKNHRKKLLLTYDQNDDLVAEAARPGTCPQAVRRPIPRNAINIFRCDPVGSSRDPTHPKLSPWMLPTSFVPEDHPHRVVGVKIGFESEPIIETEPESQYGEA